MGMVAPVYYSAEMVRALPDDGKRYETVHGELLVTPAPTAWHQEIIDRLRDQLKPFIKKHSVGHLFSAPADISWGPDVLVQPDLFVVPLDQARTFDWSQMQDLLLSIEVLSPSTSRYDRFTKRRLYQEVGIPLYWIVDPQARAVEVWTPSATFPEVAGENVVWEPDGVGAQCTIDVGRLFKPL